MNSQETFLRTADRKKVLVIAPGVSSRGGIVSVLRLHMTLPVWRAMNCELLPTYSDRGAVAKLWVASMAYLRAPFKIYSADIVHLHLAGQSSLLRKLPFALMARLLGRRLISHVHASSPESLFQKTPSWAIRAVLGGSDRVIALSSSWEQVITAHLPRVEVQVIPNPVQIFRSNRRCASNTQSVLFAGRLEHRKGYLVLLQAAQIILQRCPDVQFWLAGHGEVERARLEATRLGISASVHLLGWTDQEQMTKLYKHASVFCLPSFNEGVPMSVLEAMSRGTPVVCTRVGGLPEFVTDGENGLFAEVGDASSTAEKILQLLDNPAYAAELAVAAKRTVQAKCGPRVIDEELHLLYSSLGRRRPAHRASEEASVSEPSEQRSTPVDAVSVH